MNPVTLAKYLRISSEDADLREDAKLESNSIGNQRNLLDSFIANTPEFAGAEVLEFCDDGWSGKNFERPAVQKLLAKAREGGIQCILVKDLSRFGRDFLTVDSYIFRVFPFLGIRFISVNDDFDSSRPGALDGLETPFRTLLYDYYSNDLSRKVRSAKKLRAQQGRFMASFAPFGYMKDPKDKNHLIPDPAAAEIVKRIFDMAAAGRSTLEIAALLNRESVPTPMVYKRAAGCSRTKWHSIHESNFWTHQTVLIILRDERYIGANIFGKRVRKVVGINRSVKASRADWIVVRNTHEPIVPELTFQRVQGTLQSYGPRDACTPSDRLLTNKVRCGMCGYAMRRSKSKQPYYICRSYRVTDAFSCSGEQFPENELLEVLLDAVRVQASAAVEIGRLWDVRKEEARAGISLTRNTLTALKESLSRCGVQIRKLYEDFALGEITKPEYLAQKARLTEERDGISAEITRLEANLENAEADGILDNAFVEHFKQYAEISELSREIIGDVLKEVKLYPDRHMEIVWNYSDDYKSLSIESVGETMDGEQGTDPLSDLLSDRIRE